MSLHNLLFSLLTPKQGHPYFSLGKPVFRCKVRIFTEPSITFYGLKVFYAKCLQRPTLTGVFSVYPYAHYHLNAFTTN